MAGDFFIQADQSKDDADDHEHSRQGELDYRSPRVCSSDKMTPREIQNFGAC